MPLWCGLTARLIFAKETNTSVTDVAADRADEGYPQAISSGWVGVVESDLDAAVVWPNGKALFFSRETIRPLRHLRRS
jgi:hypothetical protein